MSFKAQLARPSCEAGVSTFVARLSLNNWLACVVSVERILRSFIYPLSETVGNSDAAKDSSVSTNQGVKTRMADQRNRSIGSRRVMNCH